MSESKATVLPDQTALTTDACAMCGSSHSYVTYGDRSRCYSCRHLTGPSVTCTCVRCFICARCKQNNPQGYVGGDLCQPCVQRDRQLQKQRRLAADIGTGFAIGAAITCAA